MAAVVRQTRENSVGPPWSSKFLFTSRNTLIDDDSTFGGGTSWHLFRKRKRTSPSPSRSRRSDTFTTATTPRRSTPSLANSAGGIILSSEDLARVNQMLGGTNSDLASLPINQARRLDQHQQKLSCMPHHASTWPGRRPSSTRLRELCPARNVNPKELAKPPELSRPYCRRRVGNVWQPRPEPGWRVATKRRSPESIFTTIYPMYCAGIDSPLVTGKPFTVYFEGEIRPGDSEDAIRLALGFVAGEDAVSRMPGCERWSLGVQCSEGRLFVNGHAVENVHTGAFEPGQQLGIGLNYAVSNQAQQTEDSGVSVASPSSIDGEVFVTRDGKKIGSWKLCELMRGSESLSFEGLEGQHDLYAAVGTLGEANVDILLEEKDWLFEDNLR